MRPSPPDGCWMSATHKTVRYRVCQPTERQALAHWCISIPVAALLPVAAALAQSDTAARTVAIQPSASITQTFSDNINLAPVGGQSGSITQMSAGVGLRARSGLVQGYLDYSLAQFLYAGGGQNTLQNTLNAKLDTDLIDGRAKLGVTSSIAQSAVSAFAAQPGQSGGRQSNSTEVRNLRLNPSFRGPIGAGLRYSSEWSYAVSDAKNTSVGDGSTASAAVHIEPATLAYLGWSLDMSHTRSAFKLGRNTTDDRLFGGASWRMDDLDLQLQASGGIEATDISSLRRETFRTWGLGATWTPSPRTKLAAQYDHRFYGASHSLTFEHRTALTTWRLTDSRSVSTAGNEAGLGGRGTAFDLFYPQLGADLLDLEARRAYVIGILKGLGISDPFLPVGFLRSSATLQNTQEASVAWRDVRSAAVLSYTRTTTQRLDTVAGLVGDLANSSSVRLRGVSLNLSHRLTPLSNVNLLLSEQRGQGVLASQSSQQRLISAQYTVRPTELSTLSAGLRRSRYATFLQSYGESAIFATYGIRF